MCALTYSLAKQQLTRLFLLLPLSLSLSFRLVSILRRCGNFLSLFVQIVTRARQRERGEKKKMYFRSQKLEVRWSDAYVPMRIAR